MALGDTGINTTNVGTEIGQPSLDNWSSLVGYSGLNKYSFYAPGQLTVDGSKNIVLTPPGSNYKIGDFRRYSHTDPAPEIKTKNEPGTVLYYLGSSVGFTLNFRLNYLNLYAFVTRGDYVVSKLYASSSDRSAESTVRHTQRFTIGVTSDSPLSGHSRQSAYKPSNPTGWNQLALTSVDTSWMSKPDQIIYADLYISDVANNRVINLGTSISAGYHEFTLHEQQVPKLLPGTNTGTVPSGGGWTGYTYPRINTSASTPAKCSYVSSINLSQGSGSYSFYLGLQGIHTTEQMCSATADVRMTRYDPIYGSESRVIASGVSLSNSAKIQISGTLSGWTKGNTFFYDETATITIENITYGAYASC